MKSNHVLSGLSSSALLDLLGLETKSSATRRALTYAGFVAAGVVVGATAAVFLTPKSGRQLRTDLRQGAKELTDSVTATATHAIDTAKRKAADLKNHGTDAAAH